MSDDFLASTATTGVVAIGGSATGTIEVSGDQDWFQVSLVAGQTYQFRLNSASVGGLGDPFLFLYGSTGSLISSNDDGGGSRNSLITYTASETSTYYLGARAFSNGTGNYNLSATLISDDFPATTATTGVVAIGDSATGAIEVSGDQDWFQVSLVAGQTYQFRLNSVSVGGLSDPVLSLYRPTGSPIISDDDGGEGLNSLITYTASETGTYYLGARAYSSGTGNYNLSATLISDDFPATIATTGVVTIGDSATGVIEANGDQDWFQVSLVAGQTYQFRLDSASVGGLNDPYLTLYNASGSILAANNNDGGSLNSLITFTATETSNYYLGARASSSGTGNYTISATLASDDFPATAATTGVVTIGDSATGVIEANGDQDWFQVSLVAGQTYQFRLDSASVGGLNDPYLTLYNASESILAANNNDGGSLNSLITFTATETGNYYLGARASFSGTGSYTISAALAPDDFPATTATTVVVDIGDSVTGAIEVSGDQDWFQVSLVAGQTYQFRLNSVSIGGLSDPVLSLYRPTGSPIISDDDGGDGLNSLITYTASETGTYYLGARAYSSGIGNYNLSATLISDDFPATTATTGVVAIGGSATGAIEVSGDQDWFQVSLVAGETYQFRLDSASVGGLGDPFLALYSASGSILTANDNDGSSINSLITFTAMETGNYYLGARASSSGTGNYTISATLASDDFPATAATTGVVTIGGSATGVIEANGDQDWFQVSLVAGQTYQFRLNSASVSGLGDPVLSLYDHSGSLILVNDDGGEGRNSLITYTPSETGTYYLGTRAFSSGTGNYSLSAETIVTDIEHAPAAVADSYRVTRDSILTATPSMGVLVNDSDEDGDSLTAELFTTVSHGTLNLNADGSFIYTPGTDFTGTDTFSYRAFDGTSYSPSAVVTISVGSTEPPSIMGKLEVPDSLYPAEVGVSRFSYANNSTAPLAGTLFVAQATNGGLLADPLTGEFSDSIFLLGLGDGSGALDAGETGILNFDTRMANSPLKLMTVSVSTVDFDQEIDWGALEPELKPEWLSDTQWHRVYTNFQSEVGANVGSLTATLAENGQYLASLGVRSDSALTPLAFELEQAGDFGSLIERATEGTAGTGWSFLGDLKLDFAASGDAILRGSMDLNALFTLNAAESAYYTVSASVGQAINLDGRILGASPPLHPVFSKNIDGSYSTSGNFDGALIRAADGYKLENLNGDALFFNAAGNFTKAVARNGLEVTATHDASDRIAGFSGPDGNALTIERNAAGQALSIIDANGQNVSFTYEGSSNQLASATSSRGTASFAYDAHGDLSQVTTPGGTGTIFSYDTAGRLSSVSVAGGLETTAFTYDDLGGYTITDGNGRTAQVSLAPGGQVANIIDGAGSAASLRYDAQGNLTGMQFPDGTTAGFTFDESGRPTSLTDANGATLTYAYHDTFDVPISFTDANGSTRHFTYNDQGELTQATWADGTHLGFSYDTNGNLTGFTNRRGDAVSYDYDARGRLVSESAGTSGPASYTYDAAGRLLTATANEGVTSLTYDAAGRVTKIEYPDGKSLSYTYDAGGRRLSMTDQDGKAQLYQYDAAGRLVKLGNNAGTLVDYTYDTAGNLIREDNGNGTATTYDYDIAGRLKQITNFDADSNESSYYRYSYDSAGNRISMETTDGNWSYGYDAAGQLTSAHFTGTRPGLPDKHIEYTYDAAGNRISQTEDGVTTHYTANALNQYQTAGDANLSYDTDGNLISKTDASGTWHYAYDLENRLTSVTTPAGDVTQYEYDVFGNRSAVIENGVRTEYLVDPFGLGNVVGEYADDDSLIASYAHGLGLAGRIAGDGSTAYYDIDGVGSVTGLTDDTGSLVNRYGYTPFGNELYENETIDNAFEFNGGWGVSEEANGLNYMRARFYDDDMGRFLSEDPLWLSGDISNLYRFALNKPINSVDPSGLFYEPGTNLYFPHGSGLPSPRDNDRNGRDDLLDFYDEYYQRIELMEKRQELIKGSIDIALLSGGIYGLFTKKALFGLLTGNKADLFNLFSITKHSFSLFNISKYLLSDTRNTHDIHNKDVEMGRSDGDPHLNTFDGYQYDFQAAGEFTLVQGTDPGLEIQVRQQPWEGHAAVSINTAVAMRTGDDVVGVYKDQLNPVNINGEFVAIADGETVAVGDGSIYRHGTQYVVMNGHGDGFWANVKSSLINLRVFLDHDRSGEISGLLGNHDGDKTNDIALADGTPLTGAISQEDLYGKFADSWRVTPETSLFFYTDGESTDTFTNRDFPAYAITINDLDPALRASIEELVRAAGLTEGTIEFENAVLDVALTGLIEFAEAAREGLELFGPAVGLSINAGSNTSLSEGATFSRLISFTDDADTGNDGRNYSIDWGDGSIVETGTLAAGVFSANINHSFAEGNASHTVSITVADGSDDTVTQQFTINVNDVAPVIALSGPPSVNEGVTYTLNLGAITDPGIDTVTSYVVNWGDGSSDSYSAAGDVLHTYAADGNYTISADLIDEDGVHVNAGSLAVLVNDVIPAETVRIGDAPMFISASKPNAWSDAWTNDAIRISHKANYLDSAEIWTNNTLSGVRPIVLAGGDIFRGDIGVSGQSLKTSAIPQEIEGTEALRFDLTKAATSVTIDLNAFNVDQSGRNFEAGRLQLLDSFGSVVDELTFNANATGISKTITLDHVDGFTSAVLTAGVYNGDEFVFGGFADASGHYHSNPIYSHGTWDGSDYLVSTIEFEFGSASLI
ncbi:MAG: hypothetical protein E6Q59_03200 [Nitrosomonas sp.]|nr:MAG: hypothetical protein E6Q59_03200 [Nitrosomonas sp.]